MRSLSLAPGSSSDCVSYAGFPGSAAAGMRLSESSNVAAPGRCAHHPGITPGGVICGDRDSPINRGVRVASPRVPASTLISHRRGGVRGSSCAATSSARFATQRFHDRVLSAMVPGSFSRRTVSQRPATPGPARPCHRQPPAMPLSTRSSAPGLPWGSQSGAKGNGHARTKEIAARIRVPGATQRTGNMPKGQWSQVTCAPVVVAYRVGHAFFGPMRLRRRATWDAALPGAGAAGFTLPRVIGR